MTHFHDSHILARGRQSFVEADRKAKRSAIRSLLTFGSVLGADVNGTSRDPKTEAKRLVRNHSANSISSLTE